MVFPEEYFPIYGRLTISHKKEYKVYKNSRILKDKKEAYELFLKGMSIKSTNDYISRWIQIGFIFRAKTLSCTPNEMLKIGY